MSPSYDPVPKGIWHWVTGISAGIFSISVMIAVIKAVGNRNHNQLPKHHRRYRDRNFGVAWEDQDRDTV
ncbi:hypothetical protein NXS19_009370 [Fusarium pseudograminearum]|nr:hypothetical protein NXS19_009370 [Fusarium pseudograminearum]